MLFPLFFSHSSFNYSFFRLVIHINYFVLSLNKCLKTILLAVKCPKGLYYDTSSSTCKPCQIGHISTQEGSTQCVPCPTNTSTLVEGSETCTGNVIVCLFIYIFIYLLLTYPHRAHEDSCIYLLIYLFIYLFV